MTMNDVTKFYNALKNIDVKVWIDGGWGVDALIGSQTRPHEDLDIAIELKNVEKTLKLLRAEGYQEIRRESKWNFVFGDDVGHEIDFHVFIFNDHGCVVDGLMYPDESLTGIGTIGDCTVQCISADHLVQFHTGYPLRESDYHDVSILCEKFGLVYPEEYAHLKKNNYIMKFLNLPKVEMVSEDTREEMIAFLKRHDNYSLFLLGNFENYGATISESPYSGNFKIIRLYDEIITVFCLTKKGNLLIQSVIKEPIFDLVLASCLEEPMPLNGLVGDWDFCHIFWKFVKDKKVIQHETFTSKEILYQIDLNNMPCVSQSNVRLLTADDYNQWKPLRLDYIVEEGLPNDLTDDQLLELFVDKCEKKVIWGFFLMDQLVSIADLNAKTFDLGQLGGVYTAPHFRKKGYSRSVIHKLLSDIRTIHNIRKLIIFTGENNLPAQKLYTSFGANQIGHFAVLFGK